MFDPHKQQQFGYEIPVRIWACLRKVWTLNHDEQSYLDARFILHVTGAAIHNRIWISPETHKPYFCYKSYVFELEYVGPLCETWILKTAPDQEYLLSCRVVKNGVAIALVKWIQPTKQLDGIMKLEE